ncbi:protein ALP1-like, partial [Aphis craccivora]
YTILIQQSTSHAIITNFLLVINDVATVAALENIEKCNSLRGLSSFPNVFDCIDGFHINTLFPWKKKDYNVKVGLKYVLQQKTSSICCTASWYSVTGIVDAEMKLIDIFADWPGRSRNDQIFRCSTINQTIINNPSSILPNSSYILGDGAYPLTEGLMTPYKDNGNLNLREKNFNYKLRSSRVLIGIGPILPKYCYSNVQFSQFWNKILI